MNLLYTNKSFVARISFLVSLSSYPFSMLLFWLLLNTLLLMLKRNQSMCIDWRQRQFILIRPTGRLPPFLMPVIIDGDGLWRRMSMAPSSLILSRGGIVTYQNDSNSLFLHNNGGSNDMIATNSQVGRSKSNSRNRGAGSNGKWQSSSGTSQQHQQLLKDVIRSNSRMSSNSTSCSASSIVYPLMLLLVVLHLESSCLHFTILHHIF